jgi:hypothetical protein
MTDENRLAEIKRLQAEFAEASRMYCLAYDYADEGNVWGQRIAQDATGYWGNVLHDIAAKFRALTGRLPRL